MYLFHKILILLVGVAISVHAVPPDLNYAGQVAVNGEAFDGNCPLQVGNAVDVGGGMEKVVYRSRQKRSDNGGKQLYIRFG